MGKQAMWIAPFQVLIVMVSACDPPQVLQTEIDLSGVPDSEIGRRVAAGLTVGGDEVNQVALELWLADRCEIADRQSAIACGRDIGMDCSDNAEDVPICTSQATMRSRSKGRPWASRTAFVGLDYESAPILTYRSTTEGLR